MQYDPLKKEAGGIFNRFRTGRILFYKILDMLLLRSWYIRREIRKWKRSLKTGKDINILDAGSGFGQYVYFISGLSKRFYVKGIELNKNLVSECRDFFSATKRSGRVDFETGDLAAFTEKNRYTLILCVDVMEHIEKDTEVFSNFYKSLVPGGMLLISTPFGDDSGNFENSESPFVDEHVRHGYTPEGIETKLKKAGFSEIDSVFSYGSPGHISWKLSLKYPVILYNKSRLLFLLIPFYYIIVLPFCMILNLVDLYRNNSSGRGLIIKAWKTQ